MSRVFWCRVCDAKISRFAAAPVLTSCPHCRSLQVVEVDPVAGPGAPSVRSNPTESQASAGSEQSSSRKDDSQTSLGPDTTVDFGQDAIPAEFACLRGEPCTRIAGGKCPGGVGC